MTIRFIAQAQRAGQGYCPGQVVEWDAETENAYIEAGQAVPHDRDGEVGYWIVGQAEESARIDALDPELTDEDDPDDVDTEILDEKTREKAALESPEAAGEDGDSSDGVASDNSPEEESAADAVEDVDAAEVEPVPISALGLDAKIEKNLADVGITTVGALAIYVYDGGDLTALEGIGKASAAKINEALKAYE